MSISFGSVFEFVRKRFIAKASLSLFLVIVADILFFDAPIGWTLGAYGALLLGALALSVSDIDRLASARLLWGLAAGLCFGLWIHPSLLGGALLWICLVVLAIAHKIRRDGRALSWVKGIIIHTILGWFTAIGTIGTLALLRRKGSDFDLLKLLQYAMMPIFLTVVFVMLFKSANPLLGGMLAKINLASLLAHLSMSRIVFWVITLGMTWGLLRPRMSLQSSAKQKKQGTDPWGDLFSEHSILLSLIIFNSLFLGQNVTDLMFLWGGAALPEGMTFADYAHRGAYPLIITALLAAAFVLIALRESSPARQNYWLRGLIYLWVGQNIILVLSAILRTLTYIDTYALTLLRLSALIWMVIVATGLVLIIIRMARNTSTTWLINTNLVTLLTVLYVCVFLDLSGAVANYNVRHAREVTGHGVTIDVAYLVDLGPSAIPALLWIRQQDLSETKRSDLDQRLAVLTAQLHRRQSDWRGWTYRNYRIAKQLEE